MKHLTNRPNPSLAAVALLALGGLCGIVPWSVRAQDNAAEEKAKMERVSSVSPFSKKLYAELGVTESQQKQIQEVRDQAVQRVGKVLTAEQRQHLPVFGRRTVRRKLPWKGCDIPGRR